MIEITLRAQRCDYAVGETPDVEVRVRNTSAAPLLFVGVLEGSEFGLRFPHYRPHVTVAPGSWSEPEWPDFTAPLRRTDFRTLPPGEEFDPTDAAGGSAYVPIVTFQRLAETQGVYTVSLTVSTESESLEQWFGTLPAEADQTVASLIARVPRLTVHSNLLTLDVRSR